MTGGGGSNTLIGPNLSLTWDVTRRRLRRRAGRDRPALLPLGRQPRTAGRARTISPSTTAAASSGQHRRRQRHRNPRLLGLQQPRRGHAHRVAAAAASAARRPATWAGGLTGIGTLVGGNGSSTLTGERPRRRGRQHLDPGQHRDVRRRQRHPADFSGFGTLKGGAGQNIFDILTDAHDLGLVTADLHGGPGNNTFSFQGGTDLQGSIYGGGGVNTIDDTAFGSGLAVTLTGYDTTGYAGTQFDTTFHDVNAVNVPAASGSNLIGDPALSTWSLAAGTYSDGHAALTFSGFTASPAATAATRSTSMPPPRWTSSPAAATTPSPCRPGATLTGSITGGSGNSTISYAAYSTSVNVDLTAGTATNVTGRRQRQ